MSDWTSWQDIDKIKEVRKALRWPGVYKIQIADSEGNPFQLDRFLGRDDDGILGIGNSVNIADRIRDFLRANQGKYGKHSEGTKAFLIRIFMKLEMTSFTRGIYKDCQIRFAALKVENKAQAERTEEELLKRYFLKYGELPPLNSALPDKHVDWLSLQSSK